MNQSNRDYFDRQVGWVLDHLSRKILRILIEVPLHVEDQPSKRLMEDMGIENPEELCGYYSGIPFHEVSVFGATVYHPAGVPYPNSITIFRRGVVAASRDEQGKVNRSQLRQEIRITILHELAHLHGMDEDEISEMGYG